MAPMMLIAKSFASRSMVLLSVLILKTHKTPISTRKGLNIDSNIPIANRRSTPPRRTDPLALVAQAYGPRTIARSRQISYRRRDSNPHEGLPRRILNPLRLPFRHFGQLERLLTESR